MSPTYFVTGATGFIGRRLTERLIEQGAHVRCLVRSEARGRALDALGAELIYGDLFTPDALARGVERADAVFHLAGLTREARRGDFERVNCGGARAVAEACRASSRVPTLIAVSSLACSGRAPRANRNDESERYGANRLLRETDAPRPLSPYGRSKYNAELALQEFANDAPITVVRPPYVFGEGDLVSAQLYAMAKRRGNFVVPGWLNRYYSFIYVADLVDVLTAALERGERMTSSSLAPRGASHECSGTGVYFASSPKPILFSEFGDMVGRAFGRDKLRVFKVPPMGVLGAGVWGELVKRTTSRTPSFDWNKSIEALRGPWICSSAKAREHLNVVLEDKLEEQFTAAARWYEKEGLA